LQQDPGNVRAHAALYFSHAMNWMERWIEDYEPAFEQAGKHALRALELDPEMAFVQVANGEYQIFCREYSKAARHIDKALAINPNDPDAIATRAMNLSSQGHFEAALENARLAYHLDPYHPWADWILAESQYFCKRYQDSLDTIANSRNAPGFIRIYNIAANVQLGREEKAREALQVFLRECQREMQAMPHNIDEWLRYTRANAPFADISINDHIIDCMVQAGLKDEAGSKPTWSQSDDHSIAVLPFDNLSGDPAQEYFSDGITESIILNLSLFPGLRVKSRNSSFAFKQQIKSPGEISKELEVDYIVEGSIRKTDERVRVTVQLVEATSGNQVWGKRYDAEIENLFDLEEELSRTIATTVTGQIESDLQRIAIAKGAAHQQSYDLLLQGIYHCKKNTASDMVIAIEKLHQCLELDSSNALAHATLYSCHEMNWIDRWVPDFEASRKLCKEHASKALALNPDLGQVQVVYAGYLIFNREFGEAEGHLNRAIEINPNDSEAIAVLALKLSCQGKFEAALEQSRLALQLDPYHTWARWILSESLFFCGLYDEVLDTIAATGNPPGFVQIYKIAANVRLGRMEAARETLKSFLQHCRSSMASMPQTIDEWLAYSRDNAPFADPAMNEEIIDYLIKAGLKEEKSTLQANTDTESQPSILVLPFTNLSGDPEQEYFSDGVTESIILNLSSFNEFRVKSQHTSFAFKDSSKSIDEIAADLGVRYIIEGSIRKFGDRIRITVQLGDVASGNQLWGQRFDSSLENVLELEEELSQKIAGTISGRISSNTRLSAMRKSAKDLQSYDYYLRGINHIELFTAQDIGIAIEHFEKCLMLDPENALACSMLGMAHLLEAYENTVADRRQSLDHARQCMTRALEINPDDASAHAFMAEYLFMNKDFDMGLVHARKSVELNPTLADGYSMLAWHAGSTRQFDKALDYARQSMEIDQFHPYAGWNAGEVYRITEKYERAIETFRSMTHMSSSVHAQIAACFAGLGKIDEARSEMQRFLELAHEQMYRLPSGREEWYCYWDETMPYQYREDTDKFFDLLLKAGLCDEQTPQQDATPSIAVLPFENMSGDPEQEYFSDGITAGIIQSLGMFKGLAVKSKRSSFVFKNSIQSSREIGDDLGVDYLVEGSIRKSDSKVRISAQLVEAVSGNQVWGKQYSAEAEDVLNLEQELSQTIAATISGRIGHTLQLSAVRKPAKDLKSYDLYLRGLYHFGKFTPQDLAIAVDNFEQCIKIDPDNAEAHMQLGMIHEIYRYENWTEDRDKSSEVAGYHLRKAVEIAPDNAWAHAYLSEDLLNTQDLDQAEYHADKAIELNPNSSEAYASKAQVTMLNRRYEEALECARRCVQLDPYSSGAAWAAGEVYLVCGEYEKSVKTFRSIETPPNVVRAQIAAALAGMGKLELAKKEMQLFLENARKNMPDYPASTEAWRRFWREYLSFKYVEDSENYIDLILRAGLCDDMTEPGDDTPSIAVLPFENMSGDPEQEHFSDGITTDIIETLSRFEHMRTVSRYSVLQYKNQHVSIPDIAQQQNVRYILEGSVRKSGNSIRVSAELIDSRDQKICWSERYDRDLDDLFAVQDEITRNIALAMKVQLDDGDMALHRSKGATNIKAWELTLASVDLAETYIRQNILDARAMTRQAIQIDPGYAYAWIHLGWTYWQEAYCGWSDSIEELIDEAIKANQHAMSLDPDYGEAWTQAGLNHQMKHEPEKAIAACLRAVEFEPGSAEVHALTAFVYLANDDIEAARKHEQNMRNLCPIRPNWYYLVSGGIEKKSGHLDLAIELFQQGLDVEPDSPVCRFYLIDALMEKGDEKRAQRLADEIRALDKSMTGKGMVHANSFDPQERRRFHDNLAKFSLV
jgi:TolB-like protein/predicted Zn-dependent protease